MSLKLTEAFESNVNRDCEHLGVARIIAMPLGRKFNQQG